jgi:hypothetical protein
MRRLGTGASRRNSSAGSSIGCHCRHGAGGEVHANPQLRGVTAVTSAYLISRSQIADSGRLAVVAAARAAARRSSGSVATRGQLARIGTSEWLPAGAGAVTATSTWRRAGLSRTSAQVGCPGNCTPGPPDLRTGNITEGAWSMLHGILGFLPLALDFAGTFLGLALNCLSLVLNLLAQTHDRFL